MGGGGARSFGRSVSLCKTHIFDASLAQVLTPAKGEDTLVRTKVVITMGPSLMDVDLLCHLLEAGATCARVDLSWQLIENHRKCLQMLQEAMRRTRRLCAVMLDCQGREIVVRREFSVDDHGWPVHFDTIPVTAGQRVVITTDTTKECADGVFPITYPKFPAMVAPGDSIFLGRYLVTGADESSLYLQVVEVGEEEVVCEAQNSAVLEGLLTVFHQERSAEGLSNLQNDMRVLSDWDREAITSLCSEFEVDFITLSYCRSPEDVQEARDFLSSINRDGIKIVAKCETRQSLLNFRSISAEADGIIVSRGNLGLDVAPEKVALVQKGVISACAQLGKPSLITRVVDTMAKSPRPTRAEATDIANAVLDGVDGIMLGAETFRGKYPLETVKTVAAICREAEAVFDHNHHWDHLQLQQELPNFSSLCNEDEDPELPRSRRPLLYRTGSNGSLGGTSDVTGITGMHYAHAINALHSRAPGGGVSMNAKLESIASGAVRAADKVGASLIICFTHTGRTAAMLAKYRPPMPIMTLVVPYLKNEGLKWTLEGRATARQALIISGLLPVLAAPTPSTAGETLLEEAITLAATHGIVGPHDHVVAVSLSSSREAMIKVVSVGDDGLSIKKVRPKSLKNLIKSGTMAPHLELDSPTASPTAIAASKEALMRRLSRTSTIMGSRADPLLVPIDPKDDSAHGGSAAASLLEGSSAGVAPAPTGAQAVLARLRRGSTIIGGRNDPLVHVAEEPHGQGNGF